MRDDSVMFFIASYQDPLILVQKNAKYISSESQRKVAIGAWNYFKYFFQPKSILFQEEISACAAVHICVLCSRCVRSCMIHNSFASYDGDVIRACRANKAECQ